MFQPTPARVNPFDTNKIVNTLIKVKYYFKDYFLSTSFILADPVGLEPTTPRLTAVCSAIELQVSIKVIVANSL